MQSFALGKHNVCVPKHVISLARLGRTNNSRALSFLSFHSLKTLVTAEAATLPTVLITSLLPWSTRGTPFAPGEHLLFEGPEPSGSGVVTRGLTFSWYTTESLNLSLMWESDLRACEITGWILSQLMKPIFLTHICGFETEGNLLHKW